MRPAAPKIRVNPTAQLCRRPWLILAACGALLGAGSRAGAATIVWADTGSDFATSTDWTGNVAPKNDITSDIASFGTVASFQPVLAANRSVSGLAFTSTSGVTLSGAGVLTLGAKGINNSSLSGLKTISNSLILGAAQSFTNSGSLTISGPVDNGGFLLTLTNPAGPVPVGFGTVSGDVSGLGGLTKSGSGLWVISGNNSYAGTTTLSAGTLRATTNSTALGAGALALGAGTLQLANDTGLAFGNNTTITASTTVQSDVLTSGAAGVTHTLGTLTQGTSTLTLNAGGNVGSGTAGLTFGATTLSGNATYNTGAGTLLTLGALTESAARTITKTGAGTLLLNTSAGTWINNSSLAINNGTVQLGANDALGSGTTLTNVTVNANTSGATALFDLNGNNQSILALTFGGATGTSTSTNNVSTGAGTLTLGGNVTFNATGNPFGSTLSGNLDLGGATRAFTIGDSTSAPYDLTISANISSNSGAYGLTKAGAGTMLISGSNSYTGTTTINVGTLILGSNSSLGASAVSVNSTAAGGTALLDLNDYNATITTLNFGGSTATSTANVNTGAGTLTLGGNVTFTATNNPFGSTLAGNLDLGSATRTFTIGDSTNAPIDLTVSAVISSNSGAYGLTKAGAGVLLLSGANTYGGVTTVSAGILRATAASAFGTNITAAALTLNGGTVQLANDADTNFGLNTTVSASSTVSVDRETAGAATSHTLGNLSIGTATLSMAAGAHDTSGTAGLTFGNTSFTGNATFNTGANTLLTLGALSDTATRAITKSGIGTLLLNSAAGSWTNGSSLTVTNGTVQLGASGALGSGATLSNITVNANTAGATALLDLNGFDQSILALTFGGTGGTSTSTNNVSTGAGTLTLGGNVTLTSTGNPLGSTLSGNLDLGGATRTFTIGDSSSALYDLTVSANISSNSGAYGLTKSGAGTLLLNGDNSYTGTTTVSAGTLNIQSNTALGGTGGATSVASGAALELQNGLTVTGESLTLTGTGVGSNGALRNVADNNTWTGGVTLSGNTNIQSDAGQLSLSGNITGTNRTLTLDGAGDSALSGTISLGTGALIKNDGGTLTLSGTSANTYSGGTTINAGTVNLNKTAGVNALGTGAITVGDGTGAANSVNLVLLASNQIANTAALTLNADGRLALNNFTDSIDTVAGTGQIDLGSSGYLTVGANNGSSTFGGSVTGGGTLEKTGTGTLTFNSSVVFTGTLTLSGGTIDLNGYNLTVGTLHITGNSILDFGNSAASILTATTLIIDTGVTLTINNWADAVDYFYATNDPGGSQGNPPLNQITFTGGSYTNDDTKWLSFDHQITPAPEPAITGAVLAGCAALLLVWRRRRLVPA